MTVGLRLVLFKKVRIDSCEWRKGRPDGGQGCPGRRNRLEAAKAGVDTPASVRAATSFQLYFSNAKRDRSFMRCRYRKTYGESVWAVVSMMMIGQVRSSDLRAGLGGQAHSLHPAW